ncbi:hypothetical protein QYE76_006945 [Lolium multiflorum]|uniref:F-box domain-containing protein n=1 Tax=Lolium multiflorum TaxID=4521 RepID=A0AAD8RVN5_LOLMU|nr:hypothetical protein QYE76_006945 [Lolium multiflorum]
MATPHKRQCQQEPTTLMSLGDDMLAEILRRLTSLSSFARAAVTCKRLRHVISSPSYSSVVAARIMSSAPLVGYFISVIGGAAPSFHRALLGSDRDVASIVHHGKFQFADFDDYSWRLMDCRHGLLLLTSDRCMAVFDPLANTHSTIRHCTSRISQCKSSSFHCILLASGADATSFRVLCLECTSGGRVRPHVYSSRTGVWQSHQLAPKEIKPPRRVDPHSNHNLPMHAGGGRVYWRTHAAVLTSFDAGSMEFSHVPLPGGLNHLSSYAVGDAEDGTTCLVAVSAEHQQKLDMRVWLLKEGGDGSSPWERQWRVDGSDELDVLAVPAARSSHARKVYDVTAGVVLLSVGYKHNGIRYVAVRIKDTLRREGATKTDTDTDTKRQTLILADFCSSSGWLHPYFMAWPRPSLKVP